MKKAVIILAIITASIALLFAQTPAEKPASPSLTPSTTAQASAPVVAEKPVVDEPLPVEEEVEDPGMGADEIAMMDKVGEDALIEEGRISLRLKDAELKDVVRMFSTLSDANIIVPDLGDEEILQKIDVNLDNVEWKPALQAILDTNGLELYEKISGTQVYAIRKKLPAAEAVKNTRTFVFKHADISEAAAMIKGIVGGGGQVFAYPQGNAIVVKTTQDVMEDVAQIAERIDTPRKQVLIEARILELTDSTDKDRGVDWGTEKGLLKRALSVSPDLVFGTASVGNNVIDTIDQNQLTLNAGQLSLLLSALDQVADIQTVSSPKVIVANGEQATIEIITKEPVILSMPTFSDQGDLQTIIYNQDTDGTDPNTGKKRYATYDYGIMLDVTPTIYSEENIAVHIVPTISRNLQDPVELALSSELDSPVQSFPIIDEKRVETTFMLADKQTAVIGGLTETTKQDKQKKVPLLSSIPLIRHLFTYSYIGDVQTENVIFVTVSLESGKDFDLDKAVRDSRLTRKQLIRDESNRRVDEREIELFMQQEENRVNKEIKSLGRKKR